ncbi:MAG: pantoate--beta-alanine ligase [Candidatus Omnitrophica bacterium]|nr:pantoate--beta-alanine ligase [Candidatus Omnitrophota bacterium]
MRIVKTITGLRKILSRNPGPVGFVPTMGYFHEGHLALMRRAKKENACCVASIFVNPLQFGPSEDLDLYPRDLERDQRLARSSGVDILFVPEVSEMYPAGEPFSFVDVKHITDSLCGSARPGHFRGVATVVAKLLHIVQPRAMYLGQKDAQQVAVLTRMVRELSFPVKVVVCSTVREADGLAMSSRNSRLTPSERLQAPALYQALSRARALCAAGERDAAKIIFKIKKLLLDATSATIEYVACVNVVDLQTVRRINGDVLIALAVRFPSARLIDNTLIKYADGKKAAK